jgi:nicotinate-nucleotide pyrophosphorylase (carboxylating)
VPRSIDPSVQATATFLAKDEGVVAGIAVANQVFKTVDPKLSVQWSLKDGDSVAKGARPA